MHSAKKLTTFCKWVVILVHFAKKLTTFCKWVSYFVALCKKLTTLCKWIVKKRRLVRFHLGLFQFDHFYSKNDKIVQAFYLILRFSKTLCLVIVELLCIVGFINLLLWYEKVNLKYRDFWYCS